MIDHKALLKKYIKYLIDVEGCNFIDPHDSRYKSDTKFSDEEWSELEKLAKA